MRKLSLFFTVCLLALSVIDVASIKAQGASGGVLTPEEEVGWLIGPVGGLNLVAYSSNSFPILNSEPTCFTAKNGSGAAPWGGITAEIPLGPLMNNFIVAEVIYDSKSAKFTAENGSDATRPTKFNGHIENGSVNTSLTADLAYAVANIMFKYNFTEGPAPVGPGIQVGPSVGFRMASKLNKTVTVSSTATNVTPGGLHDGLASQTVTTPTEVENPQSIRIALRAQGTYDLAFSQKWIATPTIGYDFPITKVDSDRGWSAQSLFAGVAIRYFLKD